MSTHSNPHGQPATQESSGELTRSAARGYVRASESFRRTMANPPAPKITFAEIADSRRNAFLNAELPDVPFSGIALTSTEKQQRFTDVEQRLKESTANMRELVGYERTLAETSRTVKQAMVLIAAAIAVLAVSIGVAVVCHIVAAGILD